MPMAKTRHREIAVAAIILGIIPLFAGMCLCGHTYSDWRLIYLMHFLNGSGAIAIAFGIIMIVYGYWTRRERE
jgi:vacuolar-type H+-ATPase subunit I/STV1